MWHPTTPSGGSGEQWQVHCTGRGQVWEEQQPLRVAEPISLSDGFAGGSSEPVQSRRPGARWRLAGSEAGSSKSGVA